MRIRMVCTMRGAHPGWSTACAHCCALDTPSAWLRSSLRSTRDAARRRPAAPCRSCSCRGAHSSLHGAGCLLSFSPRMRRPNGGGGGMRPRTCGFRGRRDGREPHCVLGLLAVDNAEESLADRQLGVTTLAVRRHAAWLLGVAYGTEQDQRHEDHDAAPAANRGRVRNSDRPTMSARKDRCSAEGRRQPTSLHGYG